MMNIDEAIQYAKDLGTEEENKIDYDKDSPHMIICRKNTVKDYRQLAEWLTELKKAKNIIRVCNRVLGYLLECEIESTSTRHEVETLLKSITEYLSGGSENGS